MVNTIPVRYADFVVIHALSASWLGLSHFADSEDDENDDEDHENDGHDRAEDHGQPGEVWWRGSDIIVMGRAVQQLARQINQVYN